LARSRYVIQAAWRGGKGDEAGVVEIRLLYFPRCANHGRTHIQKRLRHMSSQAAIGPGYQYDLAIHEVLRPQYHQIPTHLKGFLGLLKGSSAWLGELKIRIYSLGLS